MGGPLNFGFSNGISPKDYTSMIAAQTKAQNSQMWTGLAVNLTGSLVNSLFTGLFSAAASGAQGVGGAQGSGTVSMKADSAAGQVAVAKMENALAQIEQKLADLDSLDTIDTQIAQCDDGWDENGASGIKTGENDVSFKTLQENLTKIDTNTKMIENNNAKISSLEQQASALIPSSSTTVSFSLGFPGAPALADRTVSTEGVANGTTFESQINNEISQLGSEPTKGENESQEDFNAKLAEYNNKKNALIGSLEAAKAKDKEVDQVVANIETGKAKQKEAEGLKQTNKHLQTEINTAKQAIGYTKDGKGKEVEPANLKDAQSKIDAHKQKLEQKAQLKGRLASYSKTVDGKQVLDTEKVRNERTALEKSRQTIEAFLAQARDASDAKDNIQKAKDGIKRNRGIKDNKTTTKVDEKEDAKAWRKYFRAQKKEAVAQSNVNIGPAYRAALDACVAAGITV